MKSVCVLGNGQLGRMLKQAGESLGIQVYPVGLDLDPTLIPVQDLVVTAEIERWPETPLTQLLAKHDHFINRNVFPLIADRLTQKQLLDSLGLPTAKWAILDDPHNWSSWFTDLGEQLIIKRRIGGYDGRGQWRVGCGKTDHLPADVYQTSIVEEIVNFTGEISLVGARNQQGHCVFYPLTHNLHQDGILKMSVALPDVNDRQQKQAQSMLSSIMDKLNYVGVMAMECFIINDQLLINELAPRVHNSGHWTQNGASVSQFELHLRAILDLPLPEPVVFSSSVMVNLIGVNYNTHWLSESLVHLHWYDKEVRAGRKVGHLNLTHQNREQLTQTLTRLRAMLPDDYANAIQWAQQKLSV